MNLQEENKALKERIAELEGQIEQEKEFPQDGDKYWFVCGDGRVTHTVFTDNYVDIGRDEIGNVFQTGQQAEFAVEKLKVEAELRKFSRPFEYGKFNYHLFFDIDGNSFKTYFTSYCPPQGAIYFESEEKAQEAVSTLGKERIKKYLFGVEE